MPLINYNSLSFCLVVERILDKIGNERKKIDFVLVSDASYILYSVWNQLLVEFLDSTALRVPCFPCKKG